jgi:hypothetical protein
VLALRRAAPELFAADATYAPIEAGDEMLAFARGDALVTVVPRFAMRPPASTINLPPGRWVDVLAGLPVALFVRP